MKHIPRRKRSHKVKHNPNHAKGRMLQRTHGAEFHALQCAVTAGQFEYLVRQTCSRSLCRAYTSGQMVYFIVARNTNSVVTILSEEQAAKHLEGTQYAC